MFRMDQLAGYDRSTILFSPEGRIVQVEYARKAMQRGTTSIGLVFKDGVVLVGKRKMDVLVLPNKKIYQIDDHIGAVFSGYSADGRSLINYARERAQVYRFMYNEPVDVDILTQEVSQLMHQYTQFGGARPFGCGLIIGGIDITGAKLLYLDPGGAVMKWLAGAIGFNKDVAENFLRGLVKNGNKFENMEFEEALINALAALIVSSASEPKPIEIELGYVLKGQNFVIKTGADEEIKTFLEKAKKVAEEWKQKLGEKLEESGEEEEL
ncbi:MAG: archaeal proteasome endopeptidase complex subunit alpha [Candidatus Njordarchaeia archaeon]|nr:archaeal proteasome endopeptidase complex subunit alpha [Candidatus Korarchaeota archaeon]